MSKRKNPNSPAFGYKRVCVDLHRTQVRFLDNLAAEKTRKLRTLVASAKVSRSDIIREAIIRLKKNP